MNKLILGDNLEVLKNMESESVDLIYLDPPFFSNRNYEVIWGDSGEVRSFQDRFSGGIDHYISWLKERVVEMYRILKTTGSIFLHCDWHASHYIKVQILDKTFGYENFRGEIVWLRANAHNDAKKKLAVLTDSILYYSKSKASKYIGQYVPLSEEYKAESYRYEDKRGMYRLVVLTGQGINPRDEAWRGWHPKNSGEGRHWAIPRELVKSLGGKEEMSSIEKLELLYANGLIEISKNGTPNYKRYLDETEKGVLLGNIWTDIKSLQGTDKERIGYPTQKPKKLLERIIKCSSDEGDIVLDPFVGGGTTIVVADKLNRSWIGIDQSVQAIKVTEYRLNAQQDLFSKPFVTQLYKYDYDTLRYKDAFEFESWIVQQYGGYTNSKQRGDLGLDGRMPDNTPIQVKRSDGVGRNVVDNFLSAVQRYDKNLFGKNKQENKAVGIIIAFSFGKGAVQEVARLKNEENVIIKLVEVQEIVPIAKKPTIKVEVKDLGEVKGMREIEFTATGESAAGIEFYAWDFDYKEGRFSPEILLDKEGKQVRKFKAGLQEIAVKVVDKEGLDSLESVRLKINGVVKLEK